MKVIGMDSSYKFLTIVLLEDGKVVASYAKECFKRQSEELLPQLIELMESIQWKIDQVDEIVITDGPGSYTGVRIAMTLAKVLCTNKKIKLSCLSTLQLYAGLQSNVLVALDARSNRSYCAIYNQGILQGEEQVLPIEEVKKLQGFQTIISDIEELGSDAMVNFVQNFKDLYPYAKEVKDIHKLTPRYLKDNDAYQRNIT